MDVCAVTPPSGSGSVSGVTVCACFQKTSERSFHFGAVIQTRPADEYVNVPLLLMFLASWPTFGFFSLFCALKTHSTPLLCCLHFEMYVLNCSSEVFFCVPDSNGRPNLYGVRGRRLCPSQWRGGLVYNGTDKGSFDDVTSFI